MDSNSDSQDIPLDDYVDKKKKKKKPKYTFSLSHGLSVSDQDWKQKKGVHKR
jgi:hypothetical protein